MSTKAASAAPLDLGLVAGARPAPPASTGTVTSARIEPVLDLGAPPGPVTGIPSDVILDLAPQPATPGTAPTFGAVRATGHGVLGRARAFAAAANGMRSRIPWRGLRARATASVAQPMAASAEPGDTLVVPAPARQRRPKLTWREQRWERRRRRRMVEEILGWIFVPIIVIAVAWGVKAGLNAFGTTPTGLITNLKAALSGRGG